MKLYCFPFGDVEKNCRVILYGTGAAARELLAQIQCQNYCEVLCFLNSYHEGCISDIPIKTPGNAGAEIAQADRIILALADSPARVEVKCSLERMGVPISKILDNIYSFEPDERSKEDIIRDLNTNDMGKIEEISRRLFPDSLPTHSQNGEDAVLRLLFHQMGIEHPSYLDIGAYHPFEGSNTMLFYQTGSRGVNVVANPDLIEGFRKWKPEDINVNAGVVPDGSGAESLEFYRYGVNSQLNTFLKEELEFNRRAYPDASVQDAVTVPVLDINSVVARYCGGKWPDLLDLDIEGMDYDVLRDAQLEDGIGPKIILAEVRSGQEKQFDLLLEEKGYRKWGRVFPNIIYIKASCAQKAGINSLI